MVPRSRSLGHTDVQVKAGSNPRQYYSVHDGYIGFAIMFCSPYSCTEQAYARSLPDQLPSRSRAAGDLQLVTRVRYPVGDIRRSGDLQLVTRVRYPVGDIRYKSTPVERT